MEQKLFRLRLVEEGKTYYVTSYSMVTGVVRFTEEREKAGMFIKESYIFLKNRISLLTMEE